MVDRPIQLPDQSQPNARPNGGNPTAFGGGWRRLLVLAAAIAVPAWATPAQWNPFVAEEQSLPVEPMGYEIAGESFPGSAFYYLEEEPYEPFPFEDEFRSDIDDDAFADRAEADAIAGPSALPLIAGGSHIDQSRALQCLTMAIYYEGASEPDVGQRAIAQVVLNRVAHPSYPQTVCGVVFQGSSRKTGCQFSFTCDGSLARKPSKTFWDRARRVARAALGGAVYRPAGLATHYHTVQIYPYWAPSLHRIGTIGAHHFYRWKGAAGRPAAFRFAHRGGEPAPAPHRRSVDAPAIVDPVALARAYEQQYGEKDTGPSANGRPSADPVAATSRSGPVRSQPPAYSQAVTDRGGDTLFSGERLPQAGDIKPEYAESGQWIGKPK